jgi:hypothetical protein
MILDLTEPPHLAVELMMASTLSICVCEVTLELIRTMNRLGTRLVAVAAATALFVGTANGKLEEPSKRDGDLLRKQAAGAVEVGLTAVEFDERAVDVEDAFSWAAVEVTWLVALVEDALGVSRVDTAVLVNDWEELDITPTDEGEVLFEEEEDAVA